MLCSGVGAGMFDLTNTYTLCALGDKKRSVADERRAFRENSPFRARGSPRARRWGRGSASAGSALPRSLGRER